MLKIGHRGAAGYKPENTLASIEKAIEIGVDYVEVDIQKTIDGHLVLMHDKRVDRTTNGTGIVSKMTLSELKSLDAGEGLPIPTLTELLEKASGQVGLMLEIISPGIGVQVFREVERFGFSGDVIYASFLHSETLEIAKLPETPKTLVLFEGIPVNPTVLVSDARASYAGLAFDSVTRQFVQQLHSSGIKVFVYTLNESNDIELAKSFGVDGIISNYPDRI